MAKDYHELLEQLRHGELSELEISTDEFMDFQKVLMEYSHKKKVIGTAKRGGGVSYQYASNDQPD
ncbi:hypothetical protein LFYK43_18820 [Ligilactobacillus salitolerans]|uniref:Uncharacterized protein n=1 Tax=Ligilactobacillus salitolerans TaxID=1808352 RepID=A0A401IV50_9LACO|nr:hypothetical protein [Ligilactobacillus salitolerans]GBG95423.1 hypothetical protein LFYK43_18820 [Ligilactobacillus salitolerans]